MPQSIANKDRFHERNPRWSPDGKQVAFQTDRTGKYQIWMVDADGSNPRQITFTEKNDAVLPVFSPDGKRLVFTESEIALFDFETSKYEKITDSGTLPFWLNDNRHFIYSNRNSVSLGDTKTKKITELFKPTAYELQNANISPDNQMIFFRYLQIDADIWLLDNTLNQ